jgi:hypothetical protein
MLAVSIISAVDYFVAFWSTVSCTRREAVVLSRNQSSAISASAGRS